jgi:septal ring factor EnvC (AmiA/AmiB activator)
VADDLVQRFRSALARVVVHPLHHFGDVITDAYVCRKADWVVIEQHADALARKDAEIAELRKEVEALDETIDRLRERAQTAEARVREAQQRIAEAPTMIYGQSAALGGMPFSLNGKRVALVLLDTEEGK